ncbi:BBSome complex assembly protein BBS10 [Rhinophrynus dorsalis]
MQQHVADLDLCKILQVAESLEDILCRCFGPDGGHVLFITSTGDLLITKDGRKILESLLMDHPIGRMIVNSAANHASITGDGVKSFVILLCGVLRGLWAAVHKNEGLRLSRTSAGKTRFQKQGHVLKRISNQLMTFQTEVLDPIFREQLKPHFLSVFSNNTLCNRYLQSVLDTYFFGRIGHNNQEFISKLAYDFFCRLLESNNSIDEVVDFVTGYFPELHTEVLGLPVENSRILQGLVLHRQFSLYCPAEGELRAVIVTEQIHQSLSASDIDFVVCSDAHLQLSQQYLRQRTEKLMSHLHHNKVKLILSSVKQEEIVMYYAKQNRISVVDSLPSEEIDLVCRIASVSPLSKPLGDVFLGHLEDMFLVTHCQPILMGSNKYVHLGIIGSSTFLPHCVVICGPVKGLTEQLISAFHGAFKMLQQLFQSVDASWEQALQYQDCCKPNENVSMQDWVCQNDPACCECRLQRIYPDIHMQIPNKEENTLPGNVLGDCAVNINKRSCKCMGAHNTSLHQKDTTLQQIPGAYYIKEKADSTTTISNEPCRLKPSVTKCKVNSPGDTVSQKQSSCVNGGLVLPGGGTFEILLHYYLLRFAKMCQETELAGICTIVGDSLLCIPRHIYNAKKANTFPLVYTQLISALENKALLKTDQTGLESVSCKYQLVASVLQCISKLVTIDCIVGITRAPASIKGEESEDDL